jgi:hypothetical protein
MLEYEDFEALGSYLHKIAMSTFSRFIGLLERVKQMH